jgi:hypothetical protein
MSLSLGLLDGSYRAAVFRSNTRVVRDRGIILYKRCLSSWERRESHTTYTDYFVKAKRVPRAVRAIGEAQPTGDLHVEYDTATRTAVARERWRHW